MKVVKTGNMEQIQFAGDELSNSLNIEVTNVSKSEVYEYDTFTFSAGEIHVRFKEPISGVVFVNAKLRSSHDVMGLLMINDALRQMPGVTHRQQP